MGTSSPWWTRRSASLAVSAGCPRRTLEHLPKPGSPDSASRVRTSSSSSAVQASQRSRTSRYRGSPGPVRRAPGLLHQRQEHQGVDQRHMVVAQRHHRDRPHPARAVVPLLRPRRTSTSSRACSTIRIGSPPVTMASPSSRARFHLSVRWLGGPRSLPRAAPPAGSPQVVRTSVRIVSHTLDLVDDEQAWRPLSREEFRRLRRDDRLRDRGGREWFSAPFQAAAAERVGGLGGGAPG